MAGPDRDPLDAEVVRRRVIVHGRVQGVWYRASVEREAAVRRLSGLARNQRDGTVLVELEGPPRLVDEVVAWCRIGPPRAVVHRVDVEELEPLGTRSFRTT
jgi:acylphosphatase